MRSVIEMYERQPHVLIRATNPDESHIYPEQYFRRLIAGEKVEPLPDNVLRAIIKDWFTSLAVKQ